MSLTQFEGLEGFRPTKNLRVHQNAMLDFSDMGEEAVFVLKLLYNGLDPKPSLLGMIDDVFQGIPFAKPDKSQLELAVACSCCERKKPGQTSVVMGDSTEAKCLTSHFAAGAARVRFNSSYVGLDLPRGKIKTVCELISSDEFKMLFSLETRENILRNYVALKCRGLRLDREMDLMLDQDVGAPVNRGIWKIFATSVMELTSETIHKLALTAFRETLGGNTRYNIGRMLEKDLERFAAVALERVERLYKDQQIPFGDNVERHFKKEIEGACMCIRRKLHAAEKDVYSS